MTIQLSYFDFEASRGLECRLALTVAGVPFEDVRVQRTDWPDVKPTMPYGAMPVLTDGDRRLAHSNAILGYIGRKHGMFPADAWAAAEHEAVMQSVEDLRYKVPVAKGLSDDELKTKREEFATGWLTRWAQTLDDRIEGPFLDGNDLNVADLKIYVIARAFRNDGYDHIPGSFFDDFPKVVGLIEAVDANPAVSKYFASR